ncbi:DgyrCDS8132 [Dimorphilus gyrociliatus]|uniref:DgyrCDS8132 n=1 Tax=Dimorphilus gyrociliatus TaxID=2664684 RepID=A0A7I8VUX5_9ANNE|nr:DgyrCDS8132 [Dimorphilus gyrociliatus]
MDTIERNGVCPFVDYGPLPDNKISVLNSMRLKEPKGKEVNVSGYAYPTKRTGILKVKFKSIPIEGNYWIVKLGPQAFGEKNLYEYSIITDPTRLFMWVIARDPVTFKKKYDKEVREYLKKEGFNRFFNRFVENYQKGDCLYGGEKNQLDSNNKPIVPVNEVNLKKYIGRWYQAYASKFAIERTERNGFCCTADYKILSESSISVFNAMRIGSPTGPPSNISGYAYTTDRPGVLKVKFYRIPYPGNYWIIKLGPKIYGSEGLYEYAIVSEPTKRNLFVLARDPESFFDKYDKEVRDFLISQGFNNPKNPIVRTFEGSDCIYPPTI